MPPGIGYKRRPIDPRLAEILAQMGSPQGDISPVFSPGPRTDQGVFPGAEAAFGKFLARSPQGIVDTTAEDLGAMGSIAGTMGDQDAAFRAGQSVRQQIGPAIEGLSDLGIGGTAKAVGGGVAKAIDERGLGAFMSLLDIPTGGLGAAALGGMGLVGDIGKATRGLRAAGKLPDFSDLKSNAEIEAFVTRHAENDSRFSSRLAEAREQDKPRAGRPFEAQVLQEVDASLRSENPDFSLIADRALENRPSRAEGLDVAFPSQVKGARAGKVNDLAISEFGETQDWNEAGYLLSDGKMLDFSGKRDGGQGGMRAQDHREISDVFEPENRGHSSGMIEFMDLGNVRMMPESGGIGMVHKPTEQQRGALAGFIRKNDGEVIIDLEDGIGEYDAANEMYRQPKRRFSREYPQGTKHQRVFKDIGDFFSGNEPAELSQMGQFR